MNIGVNKIEMSNGDKTIKIYPVAGTTDLCIIKTEDDTAFYALNVEEAAHLFWTRGFKPVEVRPKEELLNEGVQACPNSVLSPDY